MFEPIKIFSTLESAWGFIQKKVKPTWGKISWPALVLQNVQFKFWKLNLY